MNHERSEGSRAKGARGPEGSARTPGGLWCGSVARDGPSCLEGTGLRSALDDLLVKEDIAIYVRAIEKS